VGALEAENRALKKTVDELIARIAKLETRVSGLEKPAAGKSAPATNGKAKAAAAADEDDDDIDLFGSGDDDDGGAADALREKRLAEYAAKKSKSEMMKHAFCLFFPFLMIHFSLHQNPGRLPSPVLFWT
jgi:phage shock protein A